MTCIHDVHETLIAFEGLFPIINVPVSVVHAAISIPDTLLNTVFAIIAEVGYLITHASFFKGVKGTLWEGAFEGGLCYITSTINIFTLGIFHPLFQKYCI